MTTDEIKQKIDAVKKREKKTVTRPKDLTIDPATMKMIERSREQGPDDETL